jgi:hypothetical protein
MDVWLVAMRAANAADGAGLLAGCRAWLAGGWAKRAVAYVAGSQELLARFPGQGGASLYAGVLEVEPADGVAWPPLGAPADDLAWAWRAERVPHWDDLAGRDSDERLDVLAFSRPRDALSPAAFERHYRRVHAPLARAHQPGIRSYAQYYPRERLVPGDAWEAVSAMGFGGADDFTGRMYGSPADVDAIGQDLRRFLDLASARMLCTSRHVLV